MPVHVLILAMFNVQRAITPNVDKPDLQFMCSASCLIVLYICVKFCENIEQTPAHSRNGYFQYLLCSKGCNSKSRLIRVTVLWSACYLMMLYICKKFHNNTCTLNGFQLME